jgi:hypothetical protein
MCMLNHEQEVDCHALQVIHWIGESVQPVYCHVLSYANH